MTEAVRLSRKPSIGDVILFSNIENLYVVVSVDNPKPGFFEVCDIDSMNIMNPPLLSNEYRFQDGFVFCDFGRILINGTVKFKKVLSFVTFD